MDETILRYATGWNEAYAARVFAALFALTALTLTLRAAVRRECSLLAGLFWAAAGVVALLFALAPQGVVDFIISTPYETRVRVIMGGISIVVLLITLESIRRHHLHERYAILWVGTAGVILLGALFPKSVALLRAVTGMEYTTVFIAVAFTFLVLVAFHFSISISFAKSKQAKIAQRVANLEARLRRLEEGEAGEKHLGSVAKGEDPAETEGHPT